MRIPVLFDVPDMIDFRGSFSKLYDLRISTEFNFENLREVAISYNASIGTLRGLHFQEVPKQMPKIVHCLNGAIYDVALDIDKNSNNYGRVYKFILSKSDKKAIYIPEGFAHGFQTLEKDTTIIYLLGADFSKEFEKTINPLDKNLNLEWPVLDCIISDRDKFAEKFTLGDPS